MHVNLSSLRLPQLHRCQAAQGWPEICRVMLAAVGNYKAVISKSWYIHQNPGRRTAHPTMESLISSLEAYTSCLQQQSAWLTHRALAGSLVHSTPNNAPERAADLLPLPCCVLWQRSDHRQQRPDCARQVLTQPLDWKPV